MKSDFTGTIGNAVAARVLSRLESKKASGKPKPPRKEQKHMRVSPGPIVPRTNGIPSAVDTLVCKLLRLLRFGRLRFGNRNYGLFGVLSSGCGWWRGRWLR